MPSVFPLAKLSSIIFLFFVLILYSFNKDNVNGILFKSNDLNDFVKNFYRFNIIINNKDLKKKLILNNLILSRKFSLFSHYLRLDKILKGFN